MNNSPPGNKTSGLKTDRALLGICCPGLAASVPPSPALTSASAEPLKAAPKPCPAPGDATRGGAGWHSPHPRQVTPRCPQRPAPDGPGSTRMEPGARLPAWLLALGLASTVLAPGKRRGKVPVPGLAPTSLNWDQQGPGSINWVSRANPWELQLVGRVCLGPPLPGPSPGGSGDWGLTMGCAAALPPPRSCPGSGTAGSGSVSTSHLPAAREMQPSSSSFQQRQDGHRLLPWPGGSH